MITNARAGNMIALNSDMPILKPIAGRMFQADEIRFRPWEQPARPSGCITTGTTLEETKRMMKEAIEFHLQGLREDGLPNP
jgi:hypothetical protein